SRRKHIFSEKGESQERTNKFLNILRIDNDEVKNENDRKDFSSLKRKWSSSNVKVEDDSDEERCISILRRKPVSKELQSDCKVKVKEAYVPVIEKHTERWETEAEMIIEFSRSYELCMNAMCTLHRQNIYVKEYQEKDKIRTKPDQIKKKQEAW
nr:fatty acid desaturase family protein [Tanacetum cinerariifolium]